MGNEICLTPEQEAVVKHRDGALLVSAAAGSGKTKVLVERLLDRIENGDNINEFLIITFTRAAAAELRGRISDDIAAKLALSPGNRNLRRQSLLCRGAPIDTIHGFCTDILRENAHLAGLAQDFRVLDDNESGIIKDEIVKDVLEKVYRGIVRPSEGNDGDGGFRPLIDAMTGARGDRRVTSVLLDLHSKMQSVPDPAAWAREQGRRLSMDGAADVSETVWGELLMGKARRSASYWRDEMARLRAEMREHPEFDAKYGESVEKTLSDVEAFRGALDISWDEARRLSAIEFPRPKPASGHDELKAIRTRCGAAMKKTASIFECSSAEYIEDARAIAPAMLALLQLTRDFDAAYAEEKRRRGAVDFADLEHLALSLLTDEDGGASGLARAVSRRFKEIMIDEYQDVNAVQEAIFNAVSKEGSNIFMVGDVKQSIYRFRLADPSIFLGKYNSEKCGKILLTKNFRSKPGILDAVNHVFSGIMSVEFGEMSYTSDERLLPGRKEISREANGAVGADVEFDIVDTGAEEGGGEDENPASEAAEARHIARRIGEMVGAGFPVPDGQGGTRGVRYSDIVILLRSAKNKAARYASVLSEAGIPSDVPGGEGFFQTFEIQAALALLSVVDNPMQDIPLAAALRGPVYGFTADELAEIRAGSRGVNFYEALVKAAGNNERCAAFLDDIDALRELAPDMQADRFIWTMYNRTQLPGRVGAMRGGLKRRNNLILLAEYARRFEQSGYKGLFGFLHFMRGLQERGAALAKEEAKSAPDVVRIMSIHKSKGLEFPVVFLADTAKRMNYRDMQQPLVVHSELGLGAMFTDRLRRIEYPTLARTAIQSKLTSEMLAEELRVLYVAMTRAREKLIITAAFRDPDKELGKLSRLVGESGEIAPQMLEEAKYVAGWILLPLLAGGAAGSGRADPMRGDGGGQGVSQLLALASPIGVRIVSARNESGPGPHGSAPVAASKEPEGCAPAAPGDVETLRERFGFAYPRAMAPELPSKLTVTEVKARMPLDEADFDAANLISGRETFSHAYKRPDFIPESAGLTAAERGTALHLAMQLVDYNECVSEGGVRGELERVTAGGFLSEEQREAVDAGKIYRFLASELGSRVLNADVVKREFRFSLLCPAERFYPGGGSDEILFQGVVDCFFEEDGELVVVDFKPDRVARGALEESAGRYKPQLDAYAEALERITGKRVKERVVYFFALDTAVEITR